MITSRNNREIIETVKLRKKKNRETEGLFLIDGTKLLKEAANNGIEIEKTFATKNWISKNPDYSLEITEVSEPVIEKLSGVKTSEGVVAVAKIPEPSIKEDQKYIILENIRDPGNLGTILRTCDAFGYKNIILNEECVDLYNEKTLRATMGSLFHINIKTVKHLKEEIQSFKDQGYEIIGTSLDGTDLSIKTLKVPERFCILLGNESNGISNDLLSECTVLQKIPIIGQAESLNVSIAAGIFLFLYSGEEDE